MHQIAALIFLMTYSGVALGRIPGLMLDRTGIAILGAMGMVVSGIVTFKNAVIAIDFPTILLLYALMILSAQLRLGGFYTWAAFRITSFLHRPRWFLWVCMTTSALLSAILANDIVCLSFTPVLTVSLLKGNRNPIPFLIGLAAASNIGSAATLIGNPQNMLIGQIGRLDFGVFLRWGILPSLLSLASAYLLICRIYRDRFDLDNRMGDLQIGQHWPEWDRWQSTKGLGATLILMVLFFTPIPRELSAISIAGILLCSRKMESRQILELVDWHLITLFCALFIVIQGITVAQIPSTIMNIFTGNGINIHNPVTLTALSALLSNMVSNVPATMLLIQFIDPSNTMQWYILALSSTYAGNLFIIGSIANLIVIEQAKRYGVEISFREHAAVGIPVTLCSLAVLIVWIWI